MFVFVSFPNNTQRRVYLRVSRKCLYDAQKVVDLSLEHLQFGHTQEPQSAPYLLCVYVSFPIHFRFVKLRKEPFHVLLRGSLAFTEAAPEPPADEVGDGPDHLHLSRNALWELCPERKRQLLNPPLPLDRFD